MNDGKRARLGESLQSVRRRELRQLVMVGLGAADSLTEEDVKVQPKLIRGARDHVPQTRLSTYEYRREHFGSI